MVTNAVRQRMFIVWDYSVKYFVVSAIILSKDNGMDGHLVSVRDIGEQSVDLLAHWNVR